MHMCEKWQLHCTSQWGPRCPWMSTCTWLSKYSSRSASNFALHLNIPLQKLFGWLRGHSCGQLEMGSFTTTCLVQSFFVKHQIAQVTQPHYSPNLVPCTFWFFPKLKPPVKGKRFQTTDEIQENMTGQLMAIGRIVWGPNVPTLKGTEVSLSNVQCFLYLLQ